MRFFVSFFDWETLICRRWCNTNEFEKICRDYTQIVYRFLLSLCGNEDLADELTSETFYQAYLHLGKFRGECKLETWLCQIAKNALYKENRRRKRSVPWENLENTETADSFLDALSDREQALKIHQHLHTLSEPYREVFMLRIFGELSFREIADICGKTESWAKVTFYRAKNKIVKAMEEEHEHEL